MAVWPRRRTGFGRIQERQHFFSDVVAGSLMGYGIASLLVDEQRSRDGPANRSYYSTKRIALGEQVMSFCRDRKFQPTVTCRTAQLLTVQTMVALGQGLFLVPKMATTGPHHRRDIVYKSLGEEAPKRTLCLLRHRDRSPGRLVDELAGMTRSG